MDRIAVVTGGGGGIGRGVVERLLQENWRVSILDFDIAAATATADAFDCDAVDAVQVDVTDPRPVAAAMHNIAKRNGRIDALVNCAGITRTGPTEDFSIDDWRMVIDVNLNGTFHCCRYVAQYMTTKGSIVNLASIAACRGLPGRAAYTATKFAVVGLTRVLAVEWASRNIRVNAVGPGWTYTPMLQSLVEAGKLVEDDLVAKIPMKRLGTVNDVAGTIAFLLSDDAAYITGQTLFVDGGYVWAG